MFDITAGHQGCRLVSGDALDAAEVIEHQAVDLDPYGEDTLTDAELLTHAAMELADAEVPVLGRDVDTLDEVLAEFDTLRRRYPVDQLAVRRDRREVHRTLRTLGVAS